MLQLAKHVHAKFKVSSIYPDGLKQIFDHFSSKFQNFLKKKIQKEHRKRQDEINIRHIRRLRVEISSIQILTNDRRATPATPPTPGQVIKRET
jgi:hypothetical protein